MKVHIDESCCIGCGLCESTCPQVFHLEADVSKVLKSPVPGELIVEARRAMDECPVTAITEK